MYILMRKNKALDFEVTDKKLLYEIHSSKIELHHIFPFNFMMKDKGALKFRNKSGLSHYDYRSLVNDIANITFISKETKYLYW